MANKITQVTVKEMYEQLKKAVAEGHGDKYLIAANDNEGNGYHGVFYHYSPAEECIKDMISDSQITDTSKLIIIG